MKQRVLSVLLSIALVLTSVDFTVFATEQTTSTESMIEEQESEQEMSEKDGDENETIENKETESSSEEKTTISETESNKENKSEDMTEGNEEYSEESRSDETESSENETSEEWNSTDETSESETESVEDDNSETEETVIVPELNVTGSNSLGKMLAEALAAETTEIEKNAGYNVFSIEIENNYAIVEYETLKDATLVVAIYNENGTKLLNTAKAEVTSDERVSKLYIDMRNMPSYFYLRGFLIDTVSLRPLCTVYESPMYTQEMQEFLQKTVDDFDEDKVVNFDNDKTNNFAVASDNTIIVPQNNKGENQVNSINYDTETYVISNANDTITSLTKGDTFIYEYEDGEFLIVKVSEITIGKDDTTVTITGEDISLENVFSYVKLDTEAGMDKVEIDDSVCDEGVTFEGIIENSNAKAIDIEGSISKKAALKITDKEFGEGDDQGESGKSLKISGGINLGFKVSVKIYMSLDMYYDEIKLDYSLDFEAKIDGTGAGKLKLKLLQYGFIPVAGVFIEFVPSLICEVSGEVSFSTSMEGTVGFKMSSKEGFINLTTAPKPKTELKVEATVFLGISLEPKIKIINDKIAKATLDATFGGEIKTSLSIKMEGKADKKHDCIKCIDGKISAKGEIAAGIVLFNDDGLTFSFKESTSTEAIEFYHSFDYNDGAFTKCPHYSYRVKILVQDTNEHPIFGATIKCTGNDEEKEVVTDKKGKATLYLQQGDWSINAAMQGYTENVKKISIANKAIEVKFVMGVGEIEGNKIREISLGDFHSGAVTEDGSLYMWGGNRYGQIGDGMLTDSYKPKKILDNVKTVGLGFCHSGAVTEDGSLYMWGGNRYGQIGDGMLTDSYKPKKVLDNVKTVSLGDYHSGAITEDGSLYMWGWNGYGQIGDGTTTDIYKPKKILDNVKTVNFGDYHSGAITEDGSLYMWGWNEYGQAGDGTTADIYKPKKILDNVKTVNLGHGCSGAITEDGSLYMWGWNKLGEIGDGTTTESHVPIKITISSDTISKSHYLSGKSSNNVAGITDTRIKRTMKFFAIFNNVAVSGNASFTDLTPKETYNIYEVKDAETENILSTSNLLYIGQADTDSNGSISITYEPRENCDSSVIFAVANTPVSIRGASISVSDVYADGTVKMPDVSVYYNGYELEEGTDYELSGQYSATATGDYTLTVEGIGIFGDKKDVVWHISEDNDRKLAMPTPSIISGSVVQAGSKLILTSENDSLIYYTIDGTNPTNESILYTEPITISESVTIKAIAIKENFNDSDIAIFTYTVNTDDLKMPLPTASIASGSAVQKGTEVELLCFTEDATIYYTVDGTVPTTNSLIYSKPIVVNTDMTIQAIAVKEGYENSDIATFIYIIAQGQYYTVTFNSNGGTYISTQTVQEHGKVSEPIPPTKEGYIFTGWYFNGVLYDFDEEVVSDIILEAGWTEEGKATTPTSNVASGSTVKAGTKIRLISLEGAKIYYTLDGTIPTVSSILFTEDIPITQHTVIKAFAVKEGYKDSEIATFIYDISISDNPHDSEDVLPEDIPESGIPNGLWIAGVKDVEYTGKAIKPAVRVYDYTTRLKEKRDYTISYKNNVNANDAKDETKAPSVIVKAKGNYSGKETATFKILAKDINSAGFDVVDIASAPNGKLQNPVPVLTYNGRKLSNKKHFKVEYSNKKSGAYKDKGTYTIKIIGIGNYTGERTINFTITDSNLISKAKTSKISNQPYTGKELTPSVEVKYGKSILKAGTDYEIEYRNNIDIGTGSLIIKGKGSYVGQKSVPFKITGQPINKAVVNGLDTSVYTGNAIIKSCSLTFMINGSQKTLKQGKDYIISFQNNTNAGKATVIFTGINGYSGVLKKTFKIEAYDIGTDINKKIKNDKNLSVPYCKNGSTPDPVITFGANKLVSGKDYSLSYKKNKALSNGGAEIIVKGKGNFKGTMSIPFTITPQKLENLNLVLADKPYKNTAKIYATSIKLLDTNGKTLSAGKDYDKNSITYTYADTVTLESGGKKKAGEPVSATDIIPANTRIQVTVNAKSDSYYTGTVKGIYRIIKSDIKGAKVSIPNQIYTGSAIVPKKSDITVTVGGNKLTASEFEIVSCTNNIKKGKASITIRGMGNYGGTKTVKFTIKSKGFTWWWRK